MYQMLLKAAIRYALKLLIRTSGLPIEEAVDKVADMYGLSFEEVWSLLTPDL